MADGQLRLSADADPRSLRSATAVVLAPLAAEGRMPRIYGSRASWRNWPATDFSDARLQPLLKATAHSSVESVGVWALGPMLKLVLLEAMSEGSRAGRSRRCGLSKAWVARPGGGSLAGRATLRNDPRRVRSHEVPYPGRLPSRGRRDRPALRSWMSRRWRHSRSNWRVKPTSPGRRKPACPTLRTCAGSKLWWGRRFQSADGCAFLNRPGLPKLRSRAGYKASLRERCGMPSAPSQPLLPRRNRAADRRRPAAGPRAALVATGAAGDSRQPGCPDPGQSPGESVDPPRTLPRMDFEDGIPDECRTFVVVPTLLLSRAEMERHARAAGDSLSRQSGSQSVLRAAYRLPRFRQARRRSTHAGRGRERHSAAQPTVRQRSWPFYLFHRDSVWNEGEATGWATNGNAAS